MVGELGEDDGVIPAALNVGRDDGGIFTPVVMCKIAERVGMGTLVLLL